MSEPVPPLRAYRASQSPKIPLRTLAEQIGVTEGQMSRIEREGTTSLPHAMKLSEITGLPVETFAAPQSHAA